MRFQLSNREYSERLRILREHMQETALDAVYITRSQRVFYLTSYHCWATRPMGCLISQDEITHFVPKMEEQRLTERWPQFNDVRTYLEYPLKDLPDLVPNAMRQLFKDKKLDDKRIGYDGTGMILFPDLSPPSMKDILPKADLVPISGFIDNMMLIKSPSEIRLIEEAAKWTNLAHRILHEMIAPGESELELSARASYEATAVMLKTLGESYDTYDAGSISPCRVMFHAGRRSAYPHAYNHNRALKIGDVIATNGSTRIGGYKNHLERTMILGEPDERQRKYFDLMLKTQDAAFEAMKPGVTAESVHKVVVNTIKGEGYQPEQLLLHRSGRGQGLYGYEPPTIFEGDKTILQAGMVFHLEPGIYLPEYSFRHCDTILVTEDGYRNLDYYPRDLESLTVKV